MARKTNVVVKRGNRLGFWIFRTSARAFGLSGAYGLLYFVCLYYLLFDRPATTAGMAYVKRRFRDHGTIRRIWDVYRLFISQGKSLIDRYYLISGAGRLDIDLRGDETAKKILSEPRAGVILLTAHVGNWQIAMTALRQFGRTVYLLMRPEENRAVREALRIDIEQERVKIISTEEYLGGVIEAVNALKEGNIVSIMGDRPYEYKSVEASFLGEPVRFPCGAFSIAAAAQCPVVVLTSAKVSATKYAVDLSRVIEPPAGRTGRKQEATSGRVQEFARILEEYVDRHPFQWFVFSDIWDLGR